MPTVADRKVPHIPYDRMHCPAEDCDQEGTVPGVRRHVGKKHPELVDYHFPPKRSVNGLIVAFSSDEDTAEQIVAALGIAAKPADTWEDLAELVLIKIGD